MRKAIFLAFIYLIICFVSCEKDDLTLPVGVDFIFSMDSFHIDNSSKSGNSFIIDEGVILIKEIELDGRRDEGEDYYFTSEFSAPVIAQMHNQVMSQQISYDIPQGVYNRIELNLTIGDSSEYALQLRGRFQRGPLEDIPVQFEYVFQEKIRIRAKNSIGDDQIVLTKDSDIKATVSMDVPYIFQLVNMNMIQNAKFTNINGADIMVINNKNNTDIFNLLATRLDNSMQAKFD